jgi:hypothetical protein
LGACHHRHTEEKAEKIAKRKMLTETRRAETEEKRKRQQQVLTGGRKDDGPWLHLSMAASVSMPHAPRTTRPPPRVGLSAAEPRVVGAQGFESGRRLIIDLEFGELMHDKEHKSLMSQLMYCYAANSSSAQPCRLVLTGVAGETKERYDQIPGQEQWKVERHEQPYIDAYADQKDSLVRASTPHRCSLHVYTLLRTPQAPRDENTTNTTRQRAASSNTTAMPPCSCGARRTETHPVPACAAGVSHGRLDQRNQHAGRVQGAPQGNSRTHVMFSQLP